MIAKMNRPTFVTAILSVPLALVATFAPNVQAQNLNYLSLSDTMLAVVRVMPAEDLDAELDAVSNLLSGYERSKRDADHYRQMIQDSVEAMKKDLDILKTKIELAKKEERVSDRDSLESYKKAVEAKRDYYEQAADLRDAEKRHADALVQWTKRVRTYFEKAKQLMEERARQDAREDDLATLEKELIREQRAAADRLKNVGDEMARVADRRDDLYKKREKLLKEAAGNR